MFFPHDGKTEHFKALDGLRGLAVLFVILSHSSNAKIFIHPYLDFHGIGKIGVYLFFVLSAYLLDRQIAIAFISHKDSLSYWKNYSLRRFLRIYPLFTLALIVHYILTQLGFSTVIDSWQDIWEHLLLLKGESVFWSISVEFKYYILSPFLLWFAHRVLNWNAKALLIFFLLLIIVSVFAKLRFSLSVISTFRYLPVFLVGTMISVFELLNNKFILEQYSKWWTWAGGLAFSIIVLTIPYYFNLLSGQEGNFHHSIFYFPYAALWGILLLSAKYSRGMVTQVLEFRPLRFLGAISFSLYLFHMPVLEWVKQAIFIPPVWKIYIFISITIVMSCITYLLVEKPLSTIRIYKGELKVSDRNPQARA